MTLTIEINVDSETREYYGFNVFDDMSCVFVSFRTESKPKGKRKWKRTNFWDKYSQRDSTIPEPVLTQNIKDLALERIISLIKIKTWDEYKKY